MTRCRPGRIGQIRCDVFLGLLDGRLTGMTTQQVIATLIAQHNGTDVAGHGTSPAAAGGEGTTGDGAGGGATPRDDRRGIEIRVGLSTLLGLDEHPGEIPGLGPLLAPAAHIRVALQRRAQWRFAVTDTDGQLLTEGITRHRSTRVHGAGGPAGGIVELHIPLALLQELIATSAGDEWAGDEWAGDEWAGVITDIACQSHCPNRPANEHHRHPPTLSNLRRSENGRSSPPVA